MRQRRLQYKNNRCRSQEVLPNPVKPRKGETGAAADFLHLYPAAEFSHCTSNYFFLFY